jgi:hypothetical protein
MTCEDTDSEFFMNETTFSVEGGVVKDSSFIYYDVNPEAWIILGAQDYDWHSESVKITEYNVTRDDVSSISGPWFKAEICSDGNGYYVKITVDRNDTGMNRYACIKLINIDCKSHKDYYRRIYNIYQEARTLAQNEENSSN